MKEAFERLIESLPEDLRVLEVGINGHDGENTSHFLAKRFDNIVGLNIRPEKIEEWKEQYPDIVYECADYYEWEPNEKFELIVLDLNIENNLKDWSDKELDRVHKMLERGGCLINYIMTTTEYGNPGETPQLIDKHSKKWWKSFKNEDIEKKLNSLKGFEWVACETEIRRDYITWVLLKKK